MGFKKTAEGRVFFKGSDANGSSGAPETEHATMSMAAALPAASLTAPQTPAQMQGQIVTLLRSLNERLKATQSDRAQMAAELDRTRGLVEALSKKNDALEQTTANMAKKLAQPAAPDARADQALREALKQLQETRSLLQNIDSKAERADQGVSALKSELVETRKLGNQLIEKQISLEKFTQAQAEKQRESESTFTLVTSRLRETEKKQDDLAVKLEQASAEQARLMRKLEKAVEDRTRFMRKMERFEETLLHTRDTLNAKAMVLLTDQGAAASAMNPLGLDPSSDELQAELSALKLQTRALGPEPEGDAYGMPLPWWKKPYRAAAAALGSLAVVAAVGGWAISSTMTESLNMPDFTALQSSLEDNLSALSARMTTENVRDDAAVITPRLETDAAALAPESTEPMAPAQTAPVQSMAAMDWAIDEQPETALPEAETAQEPEANAATPPPLTQDDIGTLDLSKPEDVQKLLDADEDDAGKMPNTLEPSKLTDNTQAAPQASTGRKLALDKANATDPALEAKPDARLPASVKAIEEQAFAGMPEAQHDLAAIYTAGHGGVKQNYEKAAFWFEHAAHRGVANAAYNLGVLHHQGLGVKADLKQAIGWYEKAAALGHPEAQYNLGIAYIEGIGVSYDPVKAAGFFRSAADQNITEAAYNLGLIYENGLLGEPKPDEALRWYKTAADKGNPEAKEALEQLAKSLNVRIEDVRRLADKVKDADAPKANTNAPPLKTESAKPIKKSDAGTTSIKRSAPTQTALNNASADALSVTAQIQEILMRKGLYPGPSDGVFGPQTKDAIRTYQKKNGLSVDGKASSSLLSHMLSNDTGNEEDMGEGSRAY